ncbi:MAG: hypothetical protein JNL35_19305 [Sphingopyxis sp.]|nr:hypothetical protein [Sphingopyxis sp.]
MKVSVDIAEDQIEGDYAYVDGLIVTRERWGHRVEVFGTSIASAKRGAATLRDECPNGENSYYDLDWWDG